MAAPMLAQLGAAIQKVGSSAAHATSTLSSLSTSLTQQLMAPLEVIKGVAGAIGPLVQLANPGAVWHFTRALNDLQAVIGQMVTPVLQGLTKYLVIMGDTLAGLTPVLQPLFDQLAQSLVNAAVGVAQIIQAMAPFTTLIVDRLVVGIKKASEGLAFFHGVIVEIINTMALVLGLQNNRFNPGAKAKGSAVYQPTVSGIEEFANRQFAESLKGINQNRGQGKKPEEFIPEIAAAIKDGQQVVKDIYKELKLVKIGILAFFDSLSKQTNGATDVGPGFGDALRKILIS